MAQTSQHRVGRRRPLDRFDRRRLITVGQKPLDQQMQLLRQDWLQQHMERRLAHGRNCLGRGVAADQHRGNLQTQLVTQQRHRVGAQGAASQALVGDDQIRVAAMFAQRGQHLFAGAGTDDHGARLCQPCAHAFDDSELVIDDRDERPAESRAR
jgi:hypothetical protein